ncbi:MAG: TRAP transporter small permease [Deltaproteobacteria bacterium]|nr:TRAP transporter small permease [Deltaproteobacteria bacterium]
MTRINQVIDKLIFYLLSVALGAVVGICFVQVVARYVFNASFTWAEEISIIILLWAVWWGACLAIKQQNHLRVKILEEKINPKSVLMLRLTLYGLAIIFLGMIAWMSKTLIESSAFMTLFSLPGVSRNVMNYSVPVGCVLMVYYLLRSISSDWKSLTVLKSKSC